jgi:hypothetical protein
MSKSTTNVRGEALEDLSSARRRFLLKVLGLGAAGLAAGGAGAWAKAEYDSALLSAAALPDLQTRLQGADAARAALELSHATLQAQAAEWQAQVAAATSQNAQLASALSTAQSENTALKSQAATLQGQIETLQAALEGVNARLNRSGELVSLYEQLDAAGLDGLVESGIGLMAGALAALGGPSAALRGGLASARGALTNFEAVLPEFKGAMAWLGEQVVRLKAGLWSVESSAQSTVNSAITGMAAVFGGFVGYLIDHLPFNIGARVRNTLSAVQGVLTGTTDMTDQAADKVLLKISKHVEEGPNYWGATLVTPLREQTLAPADEVLSGVSGAETTFATGLKDPAAAALAQRRQQRERIAAFRAAHGL